jgi:ribosome-associated protein
LTSNHITRLMERCQQEAAFDFIRTSGPGGQNINKVATGVRLRFDIRNSTALDAPSKALLLSKGGRQLTTDGVLQIRAERHRTQAGNRADALSRFEAWLRAALAVRKPRRKTRPTASSKEQRLRAKKVRGQAKRLRSDRSRE